jgi:AcrR family transcriptional regulator
MSGQDEKLAEPNLTKTVGGENNPADACALPGRRAAGEDPAKRGQIIDGAKRVFMSMGFDAASMNDITREAGVSKGTIYVYFENKEDLFAAMIERERNRVVQTIKHALDDHDAIEEALFDFGVTLTTHMTADATIRAMRMVVGVSDRMPQLAKRFFAATPESGFTVLQAYLDRQVAAGALDIEDTDLAARQFIELCLAGMLKRRLFSEMTEIPERSYIEKAASSAVRLFQAGYGPKPGNR